jgi:hypothetical protein
MLNGWRCQVRQLSQFGYQSEITEIPLAGIIYCKFTPYGIHAGYLTGFLRDSIWDSPALVRGWYSTLNAVVASAFPLTDAIYIIHDVV